MMFISLWDANKLNYFDNMGIFLPDWTQGVNPWNTVLLFGEVYQKMTFQIMSCGSMRIAIHVCNQLLYIKRF